MTRRRRPRRSNGSVMKAMFHAEPAKMRRSIENRALNMGINDEDPDKAIRLLDDALQQYGPETIAPEIIAYVYGFGDRVDEAFTVIEAARSREPENPMYLTVHAGLLHRHDRTDECVAVLREALTYHPEEAHFHSSLAWYGAEVVSQKALRFHMEKALELDPEGYAPHIGAYYACKHLGEADRAAKHRDFLRRHHREAYEHLAESEAQEAEKDEPAD